MDDSPESLIRDVDPIVVEEFGKTGMATPLVTVFSKTGDKYGINVLGLFQSIDPQDAARKKALLVPTVQGFITERKIDVRGYVFVCMAYKADILDKRSAKELALGIGIARLTNRVQIVVYTAELLSETSGIIVRAYGEREICLSPRKLLNLETIMLDRDIGRIGFGVLGGFPEGR
jgi:hypothetical protein